MVSPTTVLVREAWLDISEDASHRDRWLCDETILRRVRLRLPKINLNRRSITVALKTIAGLHESTNIVGLYHAEFRTICPYNTNKKTRGVHYFYRHVCIKPSFPRFQSDVEEIIARAVCLVKQREISSGDGHSETNTNPESMNPESVIPGSTNPETENPESTDPESTNPGSTNLVTVNPVA